MDSEEIVESAGSSADQVTYRALLSAPGTAQAFLSAASGRLSFGMVSLSLLFVAQQATGSFAVAGAVLTAYSVANLTAPLKARLLDRRGVPTGLILFGLPYAAFLLLYALAGAAGTTNRAVYLVLGALAGLTAPPVGTAMRTLWAAMTHGEAARRRAYSLDVAVEETLLVSGPVLTGALMAWRGPEAALLVTALTALASCVGIATSVVARRLATVPMPATAGRAAMLGPIARAGFPTILIGVLALGLTLGLIDLGAAARAEQAGSPDLAGYLLAALSLGSAAGGVLWGRWPHTGRPLLQLGALILAFGAGTAVASTAAHLVVLAVVLAVTGLALAPTLVTAYMLAEKLALDSQRSEATTWVNNALNIGAGLGAGAAGLLVERAGAGLVLLAGGLVTIPPLILLWARRGSVTTALAARAN